MTDHGTLIRVATEHLLDDLYIKCSRNYARCDWLVGDHYSSIKHAGYVMRVLYLVLIKRAERLCGKILTKAIPT